MKQTDGRHNRQRAGLGFEVTIQHHASSGGSGPGRMNHDDVDDGDHNGRHSRRTTPRAMTRDTSLDQNEREEQCKERHAFRAGVPQGVSA